MNQHWVVARVFSKRAERIREEAEGMDCGVCLPIYRRGQYADSDSGNILGTKRQLLPGYLFVRLTANDRARITELDGVYNLLLAGVRGSERLAEEMARLDKAALDGVFDEIRPAPPPPEPERGSSRRPRRSRRAKPGSRIRQQIRAMRERELERTHRA